MKNLKVNNSLAVVLLAFVLFTSCNCEKDKLFNTWVLEQYGPESSPNDVISSSQVTPPTKTVVLVLNEDGKFSGNDGCNNIFGEYEAKPCCKITFGNIKTTLMMCLQPEIMAQAREITGLMRNVEKYKVTDTSLKLFTSNDEVLIYKKQ